MGNAESRIVTKYRRAVKGNHVVAVRKLIEAGKIDPDLPLTETTDATPLMLAVSYAAPDVVQLLLTAVENKDAQNRAGLTALDRAISEYSVANQGAAFNKPTRVQRCVQVLELLIGAGCEQVIEWKMKMCIRRNRHDVMFVQTLCGLFCQSPSQSLKSIVLAIMIRIGASGNCLMQLLRDGASYSHYKLVYLGKAHSSQETLCDDVAEVIVRSTSDPDLLHYIESIKMKPLDVRIQSKQEKDNKSRENIFRLLLATNYKFKLRYLLKSSRLLKQYTTFYNQPRTLKFTCRTVLRVHMQPNVVCAVDVLCLPKMLKDYILLRDSLFI